MSHHFHVLVVGCGPAGASTAITFLRAGVSVSILACDNWRASLPAEILSPEVHREFNRLGLAENFPGEATPSYGIEAIWGHEAPTFHSYLCAAAGNGLHVDRPQFHDSLLKAVCAAGDCSLFHGRFLGAERTARGWTVTIRTRDTIEYVDCELIVDATGRSAAVARSLGAIRSRLDSLCGVSSVLDLVVPEQTLVVEATRFGWWYLAPIPRSRTLVCMISDVDIIQEQAISEPRRWLELLKKVKSISSRLGNLPERVFPKIHPCETGILDQVAGDGWIAVGDAAWIVDPLSSRGVPKALRSGREAAEACMSYLCGEKSALLGYARVNLNDFQTYVRTKRLQYAVESRWSRETFWARRLGPTH